MQSAKMMSFVECMFDLYKRSSWMPQKKESLQREVESTDKAIDKLVYELSPEGDDMG
jgi:hypothetical protein